MNWHTELVSESTVEPIATTDVKVHLNLPSTQTTDDTLIADMIKTARQYCEDRVPGGKTYIAARTWDYVRSAFPEGDSRLKIPYPPFASLTSITYFDGVNSSTTLNTSTDVRTFSPANQITWLEPTVDKLWPDSYTRSDAVTVRFIAGGTINPPVKQAMKLLCGHWYENREVLGTAPKELEFSVRDLLATDGYGFQDIL